MEGLSPPRLLEPEDDASGFDCGSPILNDWLRKRALANHLGGASRTTVIAAGRRIMGYYCLSAGAIHHAAAPGAIRRNMPEPIPVVVLGRLAVDRSLQGVGTGTSLLAHALDTITGLSRKLGIRAVLVHAKDERAAAFYAKWGFVPSPIDPLMLMVRI